MNVKAKVKKSFIVLNNKGLHTRPATELVKCVRSYKSKIILTHQRLHVNAKSLLAVLMLAAPHGTKIDIEAEGHDAKEAVDAIIFLAEKKFNIQY